MPVTVSYPGVYIEEVPSGVRTITGVATSVTAFIGRALRGPVDEPVAVNSFADYQRTFGGLWRPSTMSYAVRDFFANGGGQAVVVRLVNGGAAATIGLPGGVELTAKDPGAWGDNLRVRIDHGTRDPDDDTLYNLTVRDAGTGATLRFLNLSTDADSPRHAVKVLSGPTSPVELTGGADAQPDPHDDPPAGRDPFSLPPGDNTYTAAAAGSGEDGDDLADAQYLGDAAAKTGMHALLNTDLFNLLCVPPRTRDEDVSIGVLTDAAALCEARRAMLIVDPPQGWSDAASAVAGMADTGASLGISGPSARNAAAFFPRTVQADPLEDGMPVELAPCGVVAGVFARTDAQRGVWKAPAGLDAALNGVPALSVNLNDAENGQLNPLGLNCLRAFPGAGRVVWGARTLRGADRLGDEYKYIPVRRLALFIEESLYRGTQWVVFEPNDEPLWAQIRLNIGAFMHNLFRQGAFQGVSAREAYFVKCDKETTTQNDINLGIVNIVVGFAPLKPAEFVIVRIQQIAGQIAA